MSYLGTRVEERLNRAERVISNTLTNPDLYAVMSVCGYDAAQLREGKQLCDNVRACYQQQKNEYGELYGAKDTLKAVREQVWASYINHIGKARIAFRGDRGVIHKLGLAAERKRSLAGWLEQARQFYSNALSDPTILRKLAGRGVTQEILEEGLRQVDSVATSDSMRLQHKGAARGATMVRNQAVAALDAWMKDFLETARLECKGKPQLLDRLGLKAPTRNHTAGQPATPPASPPIQPTAATLAPTEDQPPALAPVGLNGLN